MPKAQKQIEESEEEDIVVNDAVLKSIADARQVNQEENEEGTEEIIEKPKKGKKKGVDGRSVSSKVNAAKARKQTKLALLKANKEAAIIDESSVEKEPEPVKEVKEEPMPQKVKIAKATKAEYDELKNDFLALKKTVNEKPKVEEPTLKQELAGKRLINW